MSEPHTHSLAGFLDGARRRNSIELADFRQVVFGGDSPAAGLRFDPLSAAAATRVLERALELNPDEIVVLRWFTTEPLKPFGMQTPAELVVAGKAGAVLDYIESIASGSSG
jgi:hypothetical protein